MVDLPRLDPLSLPFMVSPSVPFLQLSISESPGESPTLVDFFATHIDGSTSRARLVFEVGLWARFAPSYGDRETVREADYDWSKVPQPSTGSDFTESRRELYETWQISGSCPNPYAYEVCGSRWLAELSDPVNNTVTGVHPFRHYLVLGHDSYVEVLATGWWYEELNERKMLTVEALNSGTVSVPHADD